MQQRLLAFFGIFTGIFSCLSVLRAQEVQEEPVAIRVLIVSGGASHDFAAQVEVLKAGIQERVKSKIDWTVYSDGSGRSDVQIPLLAQDKWAEPFDLILHHHCFGRVVDADYIEHILKPHQEGTPGIIVHSSLFSFPSKEGRWQEFCGFKTVSHLPEANVNVRLVESGHPITEGLANWTSPGEELYKFEGIGSDLEILAESFVTESELQPSMWIHEFGENGSRVFATTLGNADAGLREPSYLDALSRGLLWALGKSLKTDFVEVSPENSLSKLRSKKGTRSFLHQGKSLFEAGSATAMSEDPSNGRLAQDAIDGNGETFWRAGSPGPSAWSVTLDEPVKISALAIEWHDVQPPSYHIEGSLDLLNWHTVARGGAGREGGDRSLYHFPDEAIRSIRISFPATRPGEHPAIRELSGYAERDSIPAAFVKEAALSDGLKPTAYEGLSSLVRLHPGWGLEPGMQLLPPGITPIELVECADQSVLVLAEIENDARNVYRISKFEEGARRHVAFVSELGEGSSITWDGEWLYVLDDLELFKLRDTSGDGMADEKHRLGRVFNPENGSVRIADLQLAIDGWIYARFESDGEIMGTDRSSRPVNLPANGIVRFLRDGSSFQLFVSSLQPVLELRSLGDLSFAVVTGSKADGQVSRFLQYGVFPGRPLESFPLLPAEHLQIKSNGDFIYKIDEEGNSLLVGELEGLRSIFHSDDDCFAMIDVDSGIGLFKFGENRTVNVAEEIVILDLLNDLELFPLLSSSSHVVRKEAVFEILRRKRDWRPQALSLLQDRNSPSYLASLALLSQMREEKTFELLVDAARLSHQAGAYRLLGDRKEAENHQIFGEIVKSKDPEVTTEILAAIARSDSVIEGLDELVLGFAAVDEDALSETAAEWLVQREATEVCFGAIDKGMDRAMRIAALSVLSRVPKATVSEGLVSRLEQTSDHEFRREGLAALCDLYFVDGEPWKGTPLIDSFLRASLTDRRVDTAWLLDHMLQNQIPVSELDELAIASEQQMPLQAATVALMQKQNTVPESAKGWLNSIVDESSHDPNLRAGALALLMNDLDFKTGFRETSNLLEQPLIHTSKEALISSWMSRSDLKQQEDSFRRYLNIPAKGQSQLAGLSLEAIGVHDTASSIAFESEDDHYKAGFDVFKRNQCHHCHNIHGEGSSIGPDLIEWVKNSTDEAIENAIRSPDTEVARPYQTETFDLKNGTRLRGLVKSEDKDAILIADIAGNMVPLSPAEIQSRRPSKEPLMPAHSVGSISEAEVDAMISFLRALGQSSVAK